MPVNPTYPGVYVEEIPSGVRTIVVVATSITAFLGRAVRGPVNDPRTVFNYGDFERTFGGLHVDYPMSYAVRDFFLNGGSEAVIVRLYRAQDASPPIGITDEIKNKARDVIQAALTAVDIPAIDSATKSTRDEANKNEQTTSNKVLTEEETLRADEAKLALVNTRLARIDDAIRRQAEELKLAYARTDSDEKTITALQGYLTDSRSQRATTSSQVTTIDILGKQAAYQKVLADAAKARTARSVISAIIDVIIDKTEEEKAAGGTDPEKLERLRNAIKTQFADASGAVDDEKLTNFLQSVQLDVESSPTSDDGMARYAIGDLKLRAENEGTWGDQLSIKIDRDGIDNQASKRFNIPQDQLFNLTVVEGEWNGPREVFMNVSLAHKADARRLDRVLEQSSRLVRVDTLPDAASPPSDTPKDQDPTRDNTKPKRFSGGSDGDNLTNPQDFIGSRDQKTGMYALIKTDLFNLLCIPADRREGSTHEEVYQQAMRYCFDRRAMLIVDPPHHWIDQDDIRANNDQKFTDLGLSDPAARNAALFFPRIRQADPKRNRQIDTFVPCGAIAGVIARTDVARGVWKAPGGTDATINGIQGLAVELNDNANGRLNPIGINCLRTFPVYGRVVWGARTLRGADQLADEYKYLPVRRTALYIEESLYRGLKWVVFEPNDEPLWAQIRLNVGAFMHNLFRQGAFQGTTPRDAYLVKCDKETTTQNDVNLGIVNVVVGFAPLKPAEFVIVKIQQLAGQIEV